MFRWCFAGMAALLLVVPLPAYAAEGSVVSPQVWLVLAAMLLTAKLGGHLAVRLRQPPVLGELLAGIALGHLPWLGIGFFRGAESLPAVALLAELGVVLLLFQVGLESTLQQMAKVAPQSGLVAVIGVVVPMALGFGASYGLRPSAPSSLHLFVGATFCATSVGITARVFKDLQALARPEAQVVLGAAVIDDVLGLLVLAVVSNIAVQGAMPDALGLTRIVGTTVMFLAAALLGGIYLLPGIYRLSARLRAPAVLGVLSVAVCLLLAGLSEMAGLAAIVGAFAAGLVLDGVKLRPFGDQAAHELEEYVQPIVGLFAPIFFVRTGMTVQLGGLDARLALLTLGLTALAVLGKLVAGLGVRGPGVDRLTVGIAMVPRGEVGLIFANAGAHAMVAGKPLIDAGMYAALVLTVMATTVITPPWLGQRLRGLQSTR